MASPQLSDTQGSPPEAALKIESYFIRHTGLLANQTVLKLGEYNLIVVPATLSKSGGTALVVLTLAEVVLFSQFTTQMSTLTLNFQALDSEKVNRLHIKTHLDSITPVPGRKDVNILKLKFKTCPADFEQLISTYASEQAVRREYYSHTPGEIIEIKPHTVALLGYNGYCEILGEKPRRIALRGLSTKKALLANTGGWDDMENGSKFFLKLYFKKFQFMLEATMEELPDNPRGIATVGLGFSNELLDILEDYQFRLTMLKKKAAGENIS